MIKLMYITNDIQVAKIAENAGVNRIWIDLETNGKEERQKGLDTVKSKHKIEDIGKIKNAITNSELLVRINPMYDDSKEEIDNVIKQGADIIMLPYFKTVKEVKTFIDLIEERCKTMLLVETPEAVENIDEILKLKGIDELHIGLNDLHLGYNKKFMFELLADGTVEYLCNKFKEYGYSQYGFGGISRLRTGTLPAEDILIEHYRLGSNAAILSRSFCDTDKIKDLKEIKKLFNNGIKEIRQLEKKLANYSQEQFLKNKDKVTKIVNKITDEIEKK